MMKDIIDQLIYERAPWLQAKTAGAAISDRVLKACLRYSKTIETANSLKPLNGAEIFDKLCGEIVQDTEIMGCSNIPTTGPALIVANHVFLYSAIAKTRPDVYFFANSDVLRVFPQLSEFIAPVEWRKEKRTKTRTKETLEFTKQAMKEQRIGVIFPSGRLAKRTGLSLHERSWMSSAVSLARKYSVPIIPTHISARNSILFYLLDIIHPTLRDITLFNETLNKKDFHFEIRFGKPVYPYMLSPEPEIATSDLKRRVLNLNTRQFLNFRRLRIQRSLNRITYQT
ncbi:MAG: glycerol acyltransferase [Rhodobacteraceae bacterium]|nr:glycerol acyltransferase [Paracoccaceae bacterium]